MIYRIFVFFVKIVVYVAFSIRVEGRDKIPKDGAVVLCYNHLSTWDPFVIVGEVRRRKPIFIGKKELFKNKFIARILRYFGGIPVDRGTADIRMFREVAKQLGDNNMVIISPYGTRTIGKDLHSIEIHSGATLMARKADAWIVPCTLDGNFRFRSRLKLTFGDPRKVPDGLNGTEMAAYSRDLMTEIEAVRGVEL